MSESNDYWTQADQVMHRGWLRRRPMPAPAEPNVVEPVEPVDFLMGMSVAEYAANRGSMPETNDFGVVRPNESGFPDVADTASNSAAEQMAAANPYRRHSNTGFHPSSQRGIDASLVESLDGSITGRGNVNQNT